MEEVTGGDSQTNLVYIGHTNRREAQQEWNCRLTDSQPTTISSGLSDRRALRGLFKKLARGRDRCLLGLTDPSIRGHHRCSKIEKFSQPAKPTVSCVNTVGIS